MEAYKKSFYCRLSVAVAFGIAALVLWHETNEAGIARSRAPDSAQRESLSKEFYTNAIAATFVTVASLGLAARASELRRRASHFLAPKH